MRGQSWKGMVNVRRGEDSIARVISHKSTHAGDRATAEGKLEGSHEQGGPSDGRNCQAK